MPEDARSRTQEHNKAWELLNLLNDFSSCLWEHYENEFVERYLEELDLKEERRLAQEAEDADLLELSEAYYRQIQEEQNGGTDPQPAP
jgi:hypothetical protein